MGTHLLGGKTLADKGLGVYSWEPIYFGEKILGKGALGVYSWEPICFRKKMCVSAGGGQHSL